jgi:hypothetical protein
MSSQWVATVRSDDKPLFDADVLHGIYNVRDWQKIEKSLAGIDLDATTVIGKYPYSTTDETDEVMPLREALQNLASYYAALAQLKPVPPSEQAGCLREEESKFEAAREVLSDIGAATPPRLTAKIAWARGQRKKLEAQGSASNKNAERLHRKFWGELLAVWLTLPAGPEQRTHESLRAFLLACSASIFDTTPGALTAFTKDHFKPRPRQ